MHELLDEVVLLEKFHAIYGPPDAPQRPKRDPLLQRIGFRIQEIVHEDIKMPLLFQEINALLGLHQLAVEMWGDVG